MALDFLFFDNLTGLWSVDEATGIATQLTTQTQATGGLSKGIALAGGRVFYAAHKPNGGSIADTQLWSTDGTAAGTSFVKSLPDLGSGPFDGAGIYGMFSLSNDRVVVSYYDGTASALYVSDATNGATFKASTYVGTSVPFNSPHQVAELANTSPFPNSFRFQGDGFEWSLPVGGTGASKAGAFNVEVGMATANAKIYFGVAPSGSASYTQLWSEDANSTKTLITTLPDSSNGAGGAAINALTTLSSNRIAFTYIDGSFSNESIYISNGTAAGTIKVTGYTGSAFAGPDQTAELSGALLFMDGNSGLWSVNETTDVATSLMPESGYLPSDMRTVNGKAYFDLGTGVAGQAPQLWVTDGSAAGTSLVMTMPDNSPVGGATSPGIGGIAALANGELAVDYFDGATESVWLTDGTAAGTNKVSGFSGAFNNLLFYNNSQIAEVTVACFAAGTRIATAQGWSLVENLSVGDIVATGLGPRPVQWLGHRRVVCDRHPRPEDVWPIHIIPGAFGPGLPSRDLWLSPDHAVFIEDVLIPIRHLINGRSIIQEKQPEICYWHVELSEHAVLSAEGLPAESYLDTGGRLGFDDGRIVALHPDFGDANDNGRASRIREAFGCAPLVTSEPALRAVRMTLAARAEQHAIPPRSPAAQIAGR